MAIRDDITLDDDWFRGEDKDLLVSLFQADEVTPLNITGVALAFELTEPGSTKVLVAKSTANSGIVVTDAVNGQCTVRIFMADTAALLPRLYAYVLRRVSDGTVLSNGEAPIQDPTAVVTPSSGLWN